MTAPITHTTLMTAEQVGERWQVPRAHIYRMAREGKIPVVRLGPKYVRFQLDAVEQFEREGGCSE